MQDISSIIKSHSKKIKVTTNQNHQNLLVTVERSLLVLLMVTAYNKMLYTVVKSSQETSSPIALRYADVIIIQKIRCKALWDRYADKHSKQNGIFTGASSRKQTLYIERR